MLKNATQGNVIVIIEKATNTRQLFILRQEPSLLGEL